MGNTLTLLQKKKVTHHSSSDASLLHNSASKIQHQQSEALAKEAAMLALAKKASQVTLMNLIGLADMADYFVVCTADSDKHAKAISDNIMDGLRESGEKPCHIEGTEEANWILLDYFNVVVHIFLTESRKFYNVERVWGDADITIIEDNAPGISGTQHSAS